ncbi:MAG TPA: acyl-CoA dehydrogenase family protein, partial [Pirellulales bacterium]|nr:acyl-CoA dehydrogenase family protein [Pirellulales bacterium]
MAWALTPLTEEQRAIQSMAREFAATEIAPFCEQWDRDAHFEPSLVAKLGRLGFLGMMIPDAYDGMGLDT